MKKLLITLIPLFLCGCAAESLFKPTAPEFDTSYQMDADLNFGDFSAGADITRYGDGNWEFLFTEPQYLNGMKLNLSEEDITASLGNLNVTAPRNDMYKLVPDIISSAVDSLNDIAAESMTEEEGVLTINTEVDGKKVIVTSTKDGELLTLLCPFHKVSVKFGEQTPLVTIQTIESEDMGGAEIID